MEATMRNENSGVSPKLREFGPIRVLNLMEVMRDGEPVTLYMGSDTMEPVAGTFVLPLGRSFSWIVRADRANLKGFKFALGYAYGELVKVGKEKTGFIRARDIGNGDYIVEPAI